MREPLKRPETADTAPAEVRLRIPAEPEWVGIARLAAAGIASRLNFSIEDIEDLKLAVAEACTCCIQAGGGDEVKIDCKLFEDRITISVFRAGAIIKPGPSPRAQSDGPDLGGLGVFLIRALMDEVEYESDPAGTRLVLTKLLGK
jgi:serine/threonine-protein kinase RsbW